MESGRVSYRDRSIGQDALPLPPLAKFESKGSSRSLGASPRGGKILETKQGEANGKSQRQTRTGINWGRTEIAKTRLGRLVLALPGSQFLRADVCFLESVSVEAGALFLCWRRREAEALKFIEAAGFAMKGIGQFLRSSVWRRGFQVGRFAVEGVAVHGEISQDFGSIKSRFVGNFRPSGRRLLPDAIPKCPEVSIRTTG